MKTLKSIKYLLRLEDHLINTVNVNLYIKALKLTY